MNQPTLSPSSSPILLDHASWSSTCRKYWCMVQSVTSATSEIAIEETSLRCSSIQELPVAPVVELWVSSTQISNRKSLVETKELGDMHTRLKKFIMPLSNFSRYWGTSPLVCISDKHIPNLSSSLCNIQLRILLYLGNQGRISTALTAKIRPAISHLPSSSTGRLDLRT